ncbi:MAG: adenosylmethionine--8-amino-7-oxononanoate transaminase [Acidobacteria bacterium]|nr:adenosylmethionine--8-amino-7-oxononanoate transaminase [Acidobacteriota bacterium]
MSKNLTAHWMRQDRLCVWHPYTQMLTAPDAIGVQRAEGVYLYTCDGHRILDGISSWWVNILGHNHPRLNRALQEQAGRFAQVIFAGFTHEPAARLAGELIQRTPDNLTRVFFSDNGSTAVEVALKMAYQYWRNRGELTRNLFVAFDHAYHGDTFGAMAVGGVEVFHSQFSDLFFEVRRAVGPHAPHSSQEAETGSQPGRECAEDLEEILEREGQRVAAVIMEPMVQAAGGMIIWPVEFLRHVRDVTRRHGIPLIADEVFTGFGRTGKMFACEHGPVEPDILCVSKAITGGYLPLAATLASEDIYQTFLSEDRRKTFFHGHSYSGNALACAVALESLAVLEETQGLDRVMELEALFKERLEQLQSLPIVGEVRGIGALGVLELEPERQSGYLDERGPRMAQAFLERGVLLRPLGNVLYFLPPYVITDEEAHWVFDVIEDILKNS